MLITWLNLLTYFSCKGVLSFLSDRLALHLLDRCNNEESNNVPSSARMLSSRGGRRELLLTSLITYLDLVHLSALHHLNFEFFILFIQCYVVKRYKYPCHLLTTLSTTACVFIYFHLQEAKSISLIIIDLHICSAFSLPRLLVTPINPFSQINCWIEYFIAIISCSIEK